MVSEILHPIPYTGYRMDSHPFLGVNQTSCWPKYVYRKYIIPDHDAHGRSAKHGYPSCGTKPLDIHGYPFEIYPRPLDQFGWLNTLVGGFNFSEKYESHLGLLFPIYGKTKFMFQTTNQHKILLAEAPWLVNLHLDAGRSWNSSRLQQCFRWTFPVGQQAPGTSRSCLATCHPQDFLKSRVKYHHMHT